MEVCTKAAVNRKSTDRVPVSLHHTVPEHRQLFKDDVWLSGCRQERFGSTCSNVTCQHDIEQRSRLAAPSQWISRKADEKTGRAENETAEDWRSQSEVFLPRTSCDQCGHASTKQSRNQAELFNKNNSSRNEQGQADNSGQWGHVIYEKLFDPTRTFPGLGHVYTTSRHRQRKFSRSKNDPPSFGYLDPSAMMGEYLHNYRNFLLELCTAMRRGKNYEHQIMCGQVPAQQLPSPLLTQPEPQHHPHISELSPGLWSVLAEISFPQPQDLRMEFSRLMNVVTSPKMREIWTDQNLHQQRVPVASHAATNGSRTVRSPDVGCYRRSRCETENKANALATRNFQEAEDNCIDDILAMTGILSTLHTQPEVSGTNEASTLLSSLPSPPASLSASDPMLGSRYLAAIHRNYERAHKPAPPCTPLTSQLRIRHAYDPRRDIEKVLKNNNGYDEEDDNDDDIAGLIDNARMEMQMEEEEEQEEKQRLQLLFRQLEQSQYQAEQKDPVPSGEQPTFECVPGTELAGSGDPQRGADLDECTSSGRMGVEQEAQFPNVLEEAQRQEMFQHFQQQQQLNNEQAENPEVECDDGMAENERQVRFVLRRSTVNHHLNQDLQQNIVATAPSSSFSHAFHKRHKMYQTDKGTGSEDAEERLNSMTVYVTPSLGSLASSIPLPENHPTEVLGVSDAPDLKYNMDTSKKLFSNAIEDADEDFSVAHYLTEEECFEQTEDDERHVQDLSNLETFMEKSGSKIRILGSKSYVEAYSESAALLYPKEASKNDKKDKESTATGGKEGEGKAKAEAGGQKDGKKKPVVVSVRPLSHATRRSAHSYLTQRHGSRHRQAQHKQHANKHRQSAKGADSEPGACTGQAQYLNRSECNSDDRLRAGEILTTHSTHETVLDMGSGFGQNGQGQRRSASDSDVLHKGNANSIFALSDQGIGAGDSAATLSVFPASVTYPSLSTFQHHLIPHPQSAQGSSPRNKSFRRNLTLFKTTTQEGCQHERHFSADSNLEHRGSASKDMPTESFVGCGAGSGRRFLATSGPAVTGFSWWPPHLPVTNAASFSTPPVHPCAPLIKGNVTSIVPGREAVTDSDLNAEGRIEWKLARRNERPEVKGQDKLYDQRAKVGGDEFSSKEKQGSPVLVSALSNLTEMRSLNYKPVKFCGPKLCLSEDPSSTESSDDVEISMNDMNFCNGPSLTIVNGQTTSRGRACKPDVEAGFADIDTEPRAQEGVSVITWIDGTDTNRSIALTDLAAVQDRKLVHKEDLDFEDRNDLFYQNTNSAVPLSPRSLIQTDSQLHKHAHEGLGLAQAQVCLQDKQKSDKYAANQPPVESDAKIANRKKAAEKQANASHLDETKDKEFQNVSLRPDWLPLSSFLHKSYRASKAEQLEEVTSLLTHSTGATDTQESSGCHRNGCALPADNGVNGNHPDSHVQQTSQPEQLFGGSQEDQEETRESVSCGFSSANASGITFTASGNSKAASDGVGCLSLSGGSPGERSAQKERILEEISAWFTDNPSMPCTSRQVAASTPTARRCPSVRTSHRDTSVNSARASPEIAAASSETKDTSNKYPNRVSFPLEMPPRYPEDSIDQGQEVLGAVHCSTIESVLQSCLNRTGGSCSFVTKVACNPQSSVAGTHAKLKSSCTQKGVASGEKADATLECAGRASRLFSEVVNPSPEPKHVPSSRPAATTYVDDPAARFKSVGSAASSTPTAPCLVRTDYLCNQHLIPEQFRKLIVPDLEKMMQLGKDRGWETSAGAQSMAQAESGGTKPGAGVLAAPRQDEKKLLACQKNQPQRTEECVSSTSSSSGSCRSTSHGIRITAEELFANYEAAVIGSRNTANSTRGMTVKDFPAEDNKQAAASSTIEAFNNADKKALDGSYSSATGTMQKTVITRDSRNINSRMTSIETGGGATLDVKSQGQTMPVRDTRFGPSQQLQQQQQQQHKLQQQQQHQHHLQQQVLSNSSQVNKGREQIMAAAAYYANARLSDVMTYAATGASINIPGLPRIPILSPQAAAHNAFLLKASSMRPCLQPNLSVPPPGFIPLMPVPTGPAFHHGPGGFQVGPYFSPAIFHSPNFIAMTPHPSATATFMQQTKVNICTNVSINSNISTSFSVSNANTTNRNDNHSFVYTLNNHMQQRGSSSTNVTHTTGATSPAGSSTAGDSGRKSGEPRSQCKTASSKTSATATRNSGKTSSGSGKAASVKSGSGPFTQRSQNGHGGNKMDTGSAGSAASRCYGAHPEEGRGGGAAPQGRSSQEKTREGAGTGQVEVGANRSSRGSNTDNLIRVFPPNS